MKITHLKGGSLSATYLVEDDTKYVRKEISLKDNREYGFVRWYSQVKKMQVLSIHFPHLFPVILKMSVDDEKAFYDMEYLEGFKDIKTILSNPDISEDQIVKMHSSLWRAFDELHSKKLDAISSACSLYYKEEVAQKFKDACEKSEDFKLFAQHTLISYQSEFVSNLAQRLTSIKQYFSTVQLHSEEFTHGNPTLENILYSVNEDRIVFIDLYQESIIDSKFLDYAQVLQDSRSHYGFINDRPGLVTVDFNQVTCNAEVPSNFGVFNDLFENELRTRGCDMILINALEATQFVRMLPFKVSTGNDNMAKFFYAHACKLFQELFK